ncbi:MAG: PhoH family protein [candidate division WOR-3 bacterium]|nr:PhoH family protein [candidate division WOR-3 bacterium]
MKVSIPISGCDPTTISGFQDDFLKDIHARYGIAVSMRDNYIYLKGNEKNVKAAQKMISDRLKNMTGGVEQTSEATNKHEGGQGNSIPTPKRLIKAKSPGQSVYMETIDNHDIVVSIGPAGTGKTYLAVAKAVSFLIEKKVERLVLTRPAVEAGESLGFLPGAIEEKVDPYLRPLYDALNDFLPYDRIRRYLDIKTIEIAPLAYMRGRTLNDSFIILDEAQNTTGMQMKMFLTRMGWRSKVVVTGDITQIDLPPNVFSGLIEIQHLLKNIDGIEFIYLNEKDVVRHHLVQKIIKAYDIKSST